MIRLGLIGAGKHGSRYLLPENTPEGVEVTVLPRGSFRGVDGVIIATPPASHADLACEALRLGVPVLCEKPMALTMKDAERMVRISHQYNVPFMVAHTHLWAPEFRDLNVRGSDISNASVIWGGPEREDGSCPAALDWGPHAWSMALTLGTELVSTGKMEQRVTTVSTPSGTYTGSKGYPMRSLVQTFRDLICGGSDKRADLDFALSVQAHCLAGK